MATNESKYIKCSPHIEYEVLRDNKVIYRGTNIIDMKIILEALLNTKRGDIYVIEHKRRRYMLIDDEDDLKKLNERNTNKDEKR